MYCLFISQKCPEKWQWSIDITAQQHHPTQQLSPDDRVLIQELKIICQNFIQQGLSHLAKEMVMSLHILNMQARAQNLPRLGSLLRALHGSMKQFLEADIQVDEQQIFNQLAHLYAYFGCTVRNRAFKSRCSSRSIATTSRCCTT